MLVITEVVQSVRNTAPTLAGGLTDGAVERLLLLRLPCVGYY